MSNITDAKARHHLADVARRTGVDVPEGATGDLKIWCPLPHHTEPPAKPSMMLHLDDDMFHCFGYGRKEAALSGDVIEWVRRTEGVGVVEAIRILDSGAPLTDAWADTPHGAEGTHHRAVQSGNSEAPDRDRTTPYQVRAALDAAWNVYALGEHHDAGVEYLATRGIDVEVLERFTGRREVGHTGHRGPRELVATLRARGFTDDELVDAGLARRNKTTGTVTDFYRDRVLVPIRDPDGRMCAFIGRYMGEGDGDWGKYANPSHTAVYNKSESLYQPLAAPEHEHGQVVVVEGTFDAMAIAFAAIQADAATMFCPITQSGKELSNQQLDYVLSLSPSNRSVVLAFDGDKPGVDASTKYAQEALSQGREVVVTVLPDGHDPCSYLAEHGPEGLAAWTRFGCLKAGPGEVRPQYGASVVLAKLWKDGVGEGATVEEMSARMTIVEGLALGISESLPTTARQRFQTQIVQTLAPMAAAESVAYVTANPPTAASETPAEVDIFTDWEPEAPATYRQPEVDAAMFRTHSWLSRMKQTPPALVETAIHDALVTATGADPELCDQFRTARMVSPVTAETYSEWTAPLYEGADL
jgi:DNA primase